MGIERDSDRSLADDLSSGACYWRVPLLSSDVAGKWKSSPEVTPGYRDPDVLQQILYQPTAANFPRTVQQ